MARINLLDSSIYNKIAAGEVIERPASVVKELLDNSIDAGSTDIKISVLGGGLKSIFVKDNGCGIDKDDLAAAFLPHATSKIKDENDLFAIKTLGFRGEALASVAAVAMVEIKSITEGETAGAMLKISGGQVSEKRECALSGGTQITVENLFYNTPVRLKFLKSERAEESEIVNIVSRYILCNPGIRISLEVNGGSVFQSGGGGLQDALCCVYGSSILNNLIKIGAEKGGMSLNGYIGKPSFAKPNRTYQTTALNNRLISNATISAAVSNAYGEYLVKRQYPFYVLHLTMPPELVDVNVHPNKMDVRFEDSGKIYSIFHNTIAAALHKDMQNEILCNEKTDDTAKYFNSYTHNIVEMYNTTQNILNFDDLKVKDVKLTAENPQYINNNCLNNTIDDDNNTIIQKSGFVQQQIEKPAAQEDFAAQYGIVGSLFDTYILLQLKEDVLIIDQHAAHERLLYDKYIGQYYNRELAVQYLLAPYLLSVNAPEFEYIQNNIEALRQSGFNIEVFGERVFKLSALPALLSDMDIDKFFADILKDSESGKQPGGAEELIKERFIKKACRAAVKAGYVLSNDEIDKIVKQLLSGGSLHCPHGRPIVLRYNKKEIDKLFKRVL